MDLFIMRHAWAGQHGDPAWPDDRLRPLTPEGRERFTRVVTKLVRRGFQVQAIATSPMARCRQTAEVVRDLLGGEVELTATDDLLPGSSLRGLLKWTAERAGRCRAVAWVGHAPDVGHLAAGLIGSEDGWLRFAKGGIAALRFDGSPSVGHAELRWLTTARILGC